jgi:hypothetical protein
MFRARPFVAGVWFTAKALAKKGFSFVLGSKLRRVVTDSFTVMSGVYNPAKTTVFSIVNDEMFFLPAFLDHHRQIGVAQFVFLVDGSTDGTLEFLSDQQDCMVLSSTIKFGDQINDSPFSWLGLTKNVHASGPLKEVLMDYFFADDYSIYLDADELLFLPPAFPTLGEVIAWARRQRVRAISASVVDFFPQDAGSLRASRPPLNAQQLLDHSSFFDEAPLLKPLRGGFPQRLNKGKTTELFRRFLATHHGGVTMKTPIVFHNAMSFRVGAHFSSLFPSNEMMLTIGHFKFTAASAERAAWVVRESPFPEWTQRKYVLYHRLFEELSRQRADLRCQHSKRFLSSRQFLECGLMVSPTSRR